MQQPPPYSTVRFGSFRPGGKRGYTWVAYRVPLRGSDDSLWYVTGGGWSPDDFPFDGCVTWQQILDFVEDRPIEQATGWELLPDWPAPPWYDEWIKRQ